MTHVKVRRTLGTQHVNADGRSACRLSEQCDPAGVSSKKINVFVDPFHGQQLVPHSHVSGRLGPIHVKEAKDRHPVVHRH